MNVQVTDSRYGKFMVFPNDAIGKTLIEQQEFEPHFTQVVNTVVGAGDLCIDCGANLGLHTVTLANAVGSTGEVIAVEPLRVIYQQLSGNVFLNGLSNVTTVNAALGNELKQVQMEPLQLEGSFINIGGTKVGQGGDWVNMITIDSMEIGNDVSFMKLDVQGNEVNLLEGAKATIERSRPVMFVEVEENWLRCFGTSSEKLLNKLLGLDYILLRVKTPYPCDHVAIPREKEHLVAKVIENLDYEVDVIDAGSVELSFAGSIRPDIIYHSYTT